MPKLTYRKYKPVVPGTYLFELKEIKEDPKGKWGPTLGWKCEVVDESEENGNFVTHLTGAEFGPKSKTFAFLIALGVPPEMIQDIEDGTEFEAADLIGTRFHASIVVKESDGKEYANMKDLWSEDAMNAIIEKASKQKKLSVAPVNTVAPAVALTSAAAPPPVVEQDNTQDTGAIQDNNTQQELPPAPVSKLTTGVKKMNPLAARGLAPGKPGTGGGDLSFPKDKKA